MSDKRQLYWVPKSLDAPIRIIGLTLDEFIPAIMLTLFFVFSGKLIVGMILFGVSIVLVKLAKRGQGRSWLWQGAYWYLPAGVMGQVLRKTPPSHQREYRA